MNLIKYEFHQRTELNLNCENLSLIKEIFYLFNNIVDFYVICAVLSTYIGLKLNI